MVGGSEQWLRTIDPVHPEGKYSKKSDVADRKFALHRYQSVTGHNGLKVT
jgi:hypothetical protein